MQSQLANLVTGVAPGSLGSAFVRHYCQQHKTERLVAVDKQPDPSLIAFENVHAIKCDLNPLTQARGYAEFVDSLGNAVEECPASKNGIRAAILCAGTYESGSFLETSQGQRARLIGVNICGNVEILHAVLSLNKRREVDSASALTYVQVGSLHGLTASSRCSVYSATKAIGLEWCLSLSYGREVKRAIYLAPGAIDTPMLHRNHWVSKEGGSTMFFEHVWAQGMHTYTDIFVQCDKAAFDDATSAGNWNRGELAEKFKRYKDRREAAFSQANGVLSATEMAVRLSEIICNEASFTSGVYVFTCPSGKMRVEKISFEEMIRHNS